MNVIVMIDGREAIPVRAIPFLTHWETMSPDAIVEALAHDNGLHWDYFLPLTAFRFEGTQQKPIAPQWWENFPAKHLAALSAALTAREMAGEITYEQAYIEWRSKSLLELPAGAFVWKDDFAECHSRKYNSYAMTTIRKGKELSEDEQSRRYALDFDPYIADLETCAAVMQGFERLQSHIPKKDADLLHPYIGVVNEIPEAKPAGAAKHETTQAIVSNAVVSESQSTGQLKRTHSRSIEELAEIKAFRAQHGTKKTAAHYGISAARIRQLLPSEQPKKAGYSVFSGRAN